MKPTKRLNADTKQNPKDSENEKLRKSSTSNGDNFEGKRVTEQTIKPLK